MAQIGIPPPSFFVRHGFAQHGGAEGHRGHSDWYHTYLSLGNHDLSNANAVVFVNSIHAKLREDALSVKEVLGIGEASVDAEGVKTKALRTVIRRARSSQTLCWSPRALEKKYKKSKK